MRDAKPCDIYVDENGKLWRCMATCTEPTVTFEEVEGRTMSSNAQLSGLFRQSSQAQAMQSVANYSPPIIKDRKSGAIGASIWEGWRRIFRPERAR